MTTAHRKAEGSASHETGCLDRVVEDGGDQPIDSDLSSLLSSKVSLADDFPVGATGNDEELHRISAQIILAMNQKHDRLLHRLESWFERIEKQQTTLLLRPGGSNVGHSQGQGHPLSTVATSHRPSAPQSLRRMDSTNSRTATTRKLSVDGHPPSSTSGPTLAATHENVHKRSMEIMPPRQSVAPRRMSIAVGKLTTSLYNNICLSPAERMIAEVQLLHSETVHQRASIHHVADCARALVSEGQATPGWKARHSGTLAPSETPPVMMVLPSAVGEEPDHVCAKQRRLHPALGGFAVEEGFEEDSNEDSGSEGSEFHAPEVVAVVAQIKKKTTITWADEDEDDNDSQGTPLTPRPPQPEVATSEHKSQESSGESSEAHDRRQFESAFVCNDMVPDPEHADVDEESCKNRGFANRLSGALLPERLFRKEPKAVAPWRASLLEIIHGSVFELTMGALIITNSIFMGMEVDRTAKNPMEETPMSFRVVAYFYTAVFAFELCLNLVANGCGFICTNFKQMLWNYLDLFIVISSLVEVVLDIIKALSEDQSGNDKTDMSQLRLMRIIRVTRLMRLFRIGRIVKFIRALRTLVYSIVCTLRTVIWSLILMLIIIYVYGILFTQAASDYVYRIQSGEEHYLSVEHARELQYYWGNMESSMLTLFMTIAGGLSWIECIRSLRALSTLWLAIYLMFLTFTYFAVLNVVTGVFCQSAIESVAHDQEAMVQAVVTNQNLYTARFEQLFNSIDTDGSGTITQEEFEEHIDDPKVQAYFSSLGLESSDALLLFRFLDAEAGVNIEDFVMGCLRLKGPAKSCDMAMVMHDIKILHRELGLTKTLVTQSFNVLTGGEFVKEQRSALFHSSQSLPTSMKHDTTDEPAKTTKVDTKGGRSSAQTFRHSISVG